jgi:uncharacterized membrane protein YccF (DUF307 family)
VSQDVVSEPRLLPFSPVPRLIGNILWLLLGGLEMALAYAIAGLLAFVLIVTAPLGVAAFRLASFSLWPFGRTLVAKPGAGIGSGLGNVVWILVFGWWLALGHLVAAFLNAITIIGIPFAVAHLKLAGAALTPFGHEVTPPGAPTTGLQVRPLG